MSERDPFNVELEMLREFYAIWCQLHSTPRDAQHRKKMEAIAQTLVDQHSMLKNFYAPTRAQQTAALELVKG